MVLAARPQDVATFHELAEEFEMKGEELRRQIIDELEFEPMVDAVNIGVAVNGNVVTLTGHVASYAEKLAVERAVKRIKGVHGIAEEIEVRFPEDKKIRDDEIAARALSIIAWDTTIPDEDIQVKVQHGWITLTGKAAWYFQKSAAESAVRKLSGVRGVINHIEVMPPILVTDVKHRIESALKRNAEIELSSIRLQVTGHKVIIEGHVNSWHERQVAERATWSVPGVKEVDDRLTIG
jgi:osmotically-inducible protein OsmY